MQKTLIAWLRDSAILVLVLLFSMPLMAWGYIYLGYAFLGVLAAGLAVVVVVRRHDFTTKMGIRAGTVGVAVVSVYFYVTLSKDPPGVFAVRYDPTSCAAIVSLGTPYGVTKTVIQKLNDHPDGDKARAVWFKVNGGGTSIEGERLAFWLQRRGIDTAVVTDSCESTCAVAWSYFPKKIIIGDAAPTFHASRIQVTDSRFLIAGGLSSCFINPRMCVQHNLDFVREAFSHLGEPELVDLSPLPGIQRLPSDEGLSFCDDQPQVVELLDSE